MRQIDRYSPSLPTRVCPDGRRPGSGSHQMPARAFNRATRVGSRDAVVWRSRVRRRWVEFLKMPMRVGVGVGGRGLVEVQETPQDQDRPQPG